MEVSKNIIILNKKCQQRSDSKRTETLNHSSYDYSLQLYILWQTTYTYRAVTDIHFLID